MSIQKTEGAKQTKEDLRLDASAEAAPRFDPIFDQLYRSGGVSTVCKPDRRLAQADDEQTRHLQEWIEQLPGNHQAVKERREEEAGRAARELQRQIEEWERRRQQQQQQQQQQQRGPVLQNDDR